MTYHLVEYLQISEFPENQYCIVLRWIEKNRILPVWIDAADAFELLQHEAGVPTRRPRMVNVLIDLAAATAGGFKEVHIDSYFAGDYIASLVTNNGDELECRPSDAMGVAYLLNLPIIQSNLTLRSQHPVTRPPMRIFPSSWRAWESAKRIYWVRMITPQKIRKNNNEDTFVAGE